MTATVEQGARTVARSWAVRPAWITLVVAGGVTLLVGPLPLAYQYVPLVASVLLLGLPHGAVDHLLVARSRGEGLTPRWMGLVGGLYLVLGALYGAVWFQWPVPAFAFFILLTWGHWGQGELYPLVELVGVDYLDRRDGQVLTVLVRGGAPMVLPLVAFPDQYAFVARSLVGLFDPGATAVLDPLFEPATRAGIAGLYGLAVLVTLLLGSARTERPRAWLVDATELGLLTVYFLLVPPVLAIGIYFTLWHSLRHIIRTVLLHDDSVEALDRGRVVPAAGQFARDAAPLSAVALLFLGGLYLLVPRPPGDVSGLVALYLVLIALLTLPHVVLVTWLDREQNLL